MDELMFNYATKEYVQARIAEAMASAGSGGSITPADEGKVVSGGVLVSQTAHAQITTNGTYDTTLNNSVEVAVPQPSGTKQISITQNGTTTENVADYASAEISVNVSGGGGTLLADYTATEDVSEIVVSNIFGVYPALIVALIGDLNANEWVYPTFDSQTPSVYFQQRTVCNFQFGIAANDTKNKYAIIANNSLTSSNDPQSLKFSLYNATSKFKSGFNIKVWGCNAS